MNRSAAIVSSSARRMASSGMAWPKEIVAVFTMPPQELQTGSVSSLRNAARMSSSS